MENLSPFTAQKSLFRAYDIRGDEQYFTSEFIEALALAFSRLYQNKSILGDKYSENSAQVIAQTNYSTPSVIIGYDVRCGSDDIAHKLATILQQQGLQVIHLGLVTTPMMAFWTEHYNGHGVMVTASHSAKGVLGIKWLVNNTSPSAMQIQDLYQDLVSSYAACNQPSDHYKVSREKHNNPSLDQQDKTKRKASTLKQKEPANSVLSVIALPTDIVASPYIEAIATVFSTIYPSKHHLNSSKSLNNKLDLTIVIDCMHGATSRIVWPLFNSFCQRVIVINNTPDGNFPMGNPDPTEPNRLAELQQTVIINEADIGLAFDGDGDRLMIVDNKGKVVLSDHLLYLLASIAITERPAAIDSRATNVTPPEVLFDIKCSHHLPVLLSELGAVPILSKTGSSLMRQQLKCSDRQIIFAGELSGHFIFNDGYFTAYDDAMYAGLRLLHWLVNTAKPSKYPSSAVDKWGQPIKPLAICRLTDITSELPTLVSTADHYLPVPQRSANQCSVMKQMAEFCLYLQQVVTASTDNSKNNLDSDANKNSPAPFCCCIADGQRLTLAQANELLPLGTRLSFIDGIRLDFANGFGVLRPSNTSHNLTVRFAGDCLSALKQVQAHFIALCERFDESLAEQIANIHPE